MTISSVTNSNSAGVLTKPTRAQSGQLQFGFYERRMKQIVQLDGKPYAVDESNKS